MQNLARRVEDIMSGGLNIEWGVQKAHMGVQMGWSSVHKQTFDHIVYMLIKELLIFMMLRWLV